MSLFLNSKIKLPFKYQSYNIVEIDSGASKKKFYKINKENYSYIITDFKSDKEEYFNHLKIYNLLKNINISIPIIVEKNDNNLTIISEDLGNFRFDKILQKYPIKNLLKYAVDTLIIMKNSIPFNDEHQLLRYDFKIFRKEISELPEYYFPYIELNDKNLVEEFYNIWSEIFQSINFKFDSFSHKDFNINNLMFLESREKHLKCGVIDFQSAFWGESSWDLFSLLEDSRVLFSDEFNEYFIQYFYTKTINDISLEEFKIKYYFLNASRQTRLLGRWIKLAKELDQDWYLNFISITQKRLKKSINFIDNRNLNKFYKKHIFN